MVESTLRVATWNLEFAQAGTGRARLADTQLAGHDPDVLCLTEIAVDRLPDDGNTIWADGDYGYVAPPKRRKVGLWSRYGWTEVDTVGNTDLPGGRFVAGTTPTVLGRVRVLGVCIPWRMAHVSGGRRDRAPWEDHLAYLGGLADLLTAPVAGHLLVMGDFNQRLSGRWGSAEAHDALLRTFAGLEFATGGLVPGLEEELIDHIAHSPSLTTAALTAISRLQDGVEVSDHNGVVVDLVPT